MVNVWESVNAAKEARDFCDGGTEGTVLLDESGAYADRLGISGVPTNVLVGADGIVRHVGASAPEELHAAVDALLAED